MRSSPWTTTLTGYRSRFTSRRFPTSTLELSLRIRVSRFKDFNADQEDIDLLVAFDNANPDLPLTHLVLIEAKAYLPWTNKQLKSKTGRLREIFGENGKRASGVVPHFVLMTGSRSKNIQTLEWPDWTNDAQGNPFWLDYDLPFRSKITRCTASGKSDKCGGYLRVDRVPPQ